MRLARSTRLATLTAVAAALGCRSKAPPAQPPPPVTLGAEDVVRVTNAPIATGPRLAGTLEPRERAVMRAEVGGPILAVGPEIGQRVKRGDLLVRIDAPALDDTLRSARAGLKAARTELSVARREVQRSEALVRAGAVAARDLDQARNAAAAAQARVGQAEAQVETARAQLAHATITSPIDGVVATRSVSKGDVVSVGAAVYQVIDPRTMRLSASVPSQDLGLLETGQEVSFQVRGYPNQAFLGTLSHIGPQADEATRQIPIIADLPNAEGKLVAGLFAEGQITSAARRALVVPIGALDLSGDTPTVLRVAGGVVERVPIGTGLRDEARELVAVTSGLSEGDVLVVRGDVTPGTRVELR